MEKVGEYRNVHGDRVTVSRFAEGRGVLLQTWPEETEQCWAMKFSASLIFGSLNLDSYWPASPAAIAAMRPRDAIHARLNEAERVTGIRQNRLALRIADDHLAALIAHPDFVAMGVTSAEDVRDFFGIAACIVSPKDETLRPFEVGAIG
jgi:hypothetical protein